MTREEFMKATGREPERDDLDRVNCPDAGKLGHYCCGVCACGRPAFMCMGAVCKHERAHELLALLALLMLVACGSPHKTYHASADILAPATEAAAQVNALFGCELVTVTDGTVTPKLGNGVQEMFFTDAMHKNFDALTWLGGSPDEHDITVRPKLPTAGADFVRTIIHELGHAYGLEHIVVRGEMMHIDGGDWRNPEVLARFKRALEYQGVQCQEEK